MISSVFIHNFRKKAAMKKFFLIILILVSCNTKVMTQPDQTIHSTFNFDLNRYLGTWYEIARFNHSFEKGLEGVTATYSLRNDGLIKVLNQGYKGGLDGTLSKAVGKAKLATDLSPRNLKVSFFWIFYAPYNILELDPDYQYALIGSNSSRYLWILSRSPQMDESVFQMLLSKAKDRGYDISSIIRVKQPAK